MTDQAAPPAGGQDAGQDGIRLEISPSERYTRAGAYENRGAAGEPIRLELPAGPGKIGPAEVPAEAQPGPAYYPLRRRAGNIRDAGHAAYYDAASPEDGLAAAFDYFRAAKACAAKRRGGRGGMPHPPSDDAQVELGRALLVAADDLTTAMHTWRSGS